MEGGTAGQGVVSHRPIPKVVEIAPQITNAPPAPDDLPDKGKELWDAVMPWLCEVNAVQEVDVPALKAMCHSWAQAEHAKEVLEVQGYFVLGSMGQMTAHPAVAIMQAAHDRYLRFAQDFNARFPGFDTDVHGLVENETEGFRRSYYVDCVRG